MSNSVVLNVSQAGTFSDTAAAAGVYRAAVNEENTKFGGIVVADGDGESMCSTLADFAVAIGADFIKIGAPSRGDRVINFNRLIQIHDILDRSGRLA